MRADYNFKQLGEYDYTLTITADVEGRLFRDLLQRALKATSKTLRRDIKPHEVESFDLPPEYYNVVNTYCKTLINDKKMTKELLEDGIEIRSHHLNRCVYKKNENGGYSMVIYLEGLFLRR